MTAPFKAIIPAPPRRQKKSKKFHPEFRGGQDNPDGHMIGPWLRQDLNPNCPKKNPPTITPAAALTAARVCYSSFFQIIFDNPTTAASEFSPPHPYTRMVVFRFPVFTAASMLLAKKRGPPRKTTSTPTRNTNIPHPPPYERQVDRTPKLRQGSEGTGQRGRGEASVPRAPYGQEPSGELCTSRTSGFHLPGPRMGTDASASLALPRRFAEV